MSQSPKRISSRVNPEFQQLRALARDGRTRRRTGQLVLEGEHLIESALAAGLPLRRLVLAESHAGLDDWSRRHPQVPCLILSESLMRELSSLVTPSGLMAVIDQPLPREAGAAMVLLLEEVQDPGNLGALLRTAAAAGVELACLSPGCAEAWSPKALRGGQGAQFRLAIREGVDLLEFVAAFPGEVWAAAPGNGPSLYELELGLPLAFAFGNEGAGLSGGMLARARPFRIPMATGVESLNVAAAAAVTLFEARRRCSGAGS